MLAFITGADSIPPLIFSGQSRIDSLEITGFHLHQHVAWFFYFRLEELEKSKIDNLVKC